MDALYTKLNVNDALVEALTSLAVVQPDDPIEYLGKYLLQWVGRRNISAAQTEIVSLAEEKAAHYGVAEALKNKNLEDKQNSIDMRTVELNEFLAHVKSLAPEGRESVLNSSCDFLAKFLKIPAVYISVKQIAGEVEFLKYIGANSSQRNFVIGKKLSKANDADGEDLPQRQGLSFDAFKLPEVEPEPEPEPDENGNLPPAREPPKLQPLRINNVMRDKRVKFFGIPKLGAYAAIPFEMDSNYHDSGVKLGESVDGQPPEFVNNKVKTQLLLSMDTIGNYRIFTDEDISVAKTITDTLVEVLTNIENDVYEKQKSIFESYQQNLEVIASLTTTSVDEESAFATAQLSSLSDEERAEIGTLAEAEARALFWTQTLLNNPTNAILKSLHEYKIPMFPSLLNLLFAVGCLLSNPPASMRDCGGDLSWESLKEIALNSITNKLLVFNPREVKTVVLECSASSIRQFCESNNLFDPSVYPPLLSLASILSNWLKKNLNAREVAISYFKENKNIQLETIVY